MSELRDARLNKALESAPDAHMRPDAATRAAIRRSAMAAIAAPAAAPAVTPPPSRPWWGMPWNAALASVVLASLVTVMWRNEDIPGAAPEQGDRPIPATARVAAPATPPPVAQAPAPVSRPAAAPAQTPARTPPKPSVDAGERQADALRKREAAATQKAAAEAAPARQAEMMAKSAAPAAEAPAPSAALRDQAPPPVESRSQATGAAAAPAAAPAVAAAPAPAAAPPAPMAAAAPRAMPVPAPMPAPAAPAVERFEAQPQELWNQLRADDGVQVLQLDRTQAGALPGLVRRAIASPPSGSAFAESGVQRIELLHAGKRMGVLELGDGLLRWTPEPSGPATVLRPGAALLKALRDELARLRQNR